MQFIKQLICIKKSLDVFDHRPYWYWKCQYKNPREGAAATDDLAQQSLGVEIVADGGESHQTPPERLNKGPTVIAIKSPGNLQK